MSATFEIGDGRTVWLRPAIEEDAAAFGRAVDSVAREGRYLARARFEIDLDRERVFLAEARERGDLILVVLLDDVLVGWLTLLRDRRDFLKHTAELGLGVLRAYRGLGIGSRLMEYALGWAAEQGLEKVNLTVRASNDHALALYSGFGFVQEGYRLRAVKDSAGRYDDNVDMAYFVPAGPDA